MGDGGRMSVPHPAFPEIKRLGTGTWNTNIVNF